MQVVHTAGLPPNHGKMNLLMSGWTSNSKKALKRVMSAKSQINQAGGSPAAASLAAGLGLALSRNAVGRCAVCRRNSVDMGSPLRRQAEPAAWLTIVSSNRDAIQSNRAAGEAKETRP